jgi:hypothetical protein
LTDSGGGPFGYGVDLTVYVEGSPTLGLTTEDNGTFAASFIINASIPVGDNSITVDVDTGQGITAQTEIKNITVFGNSSVTTPSVNGTSVLVENTQTMPNETLQITGSIRDTYSSVGIVGMGLSAQWEDFGLVYNTNTTSGGAFTINLVVPASLNPLLENGTINLQSVSSQYYTPSNYSFLVDVFTEAQYAITLNSTSIAEGSTVSTIGGEEVYVNSNITFSGFLTDQFGRPIKSRTITINMSGVYSVNSPINGSGYFEVDMNNRTWGYSNDTYTIIITFDDDPSFEFSFDIEIQAVPVIQPPPTTGGTTTSPTGPGGNNMTIIGLLIATISLIIIVAVVYAFGRFRRSKKAVLPGPDAEFMDLPSIFKQIEEADKAKDYRRAIVLSYRAFELVCIQELGILSALEQSPRELARLVASTNRIPVRDVTMLVMRYEEARYSDHRITKNQFNHTMQALENVQLAIKQEPKST